MLVSLLRNEEKANLFKREVQEAKEKLARIKDAQMTVMQSTFVDANLP